MTRNEKIAGVLLVIGIIVVTGLLWSLAGVFS